MSTCLSLKRTSKRRTDLVGEVSVLDELHDGQDGEQAAEAGAGQSGAYDGRMVSGEGVAFSIGRAAVDAGGSEEVQTADEGGRIANAAAYANGSTERGR